MPRVVGARAFLPAWGTGGLFIHLGLPLLTHVKTLFSWAVDHSERILCSICRIKVPISSSH
jgi:hypothetical protein